MTDPTLQAREILARAYQARGWPTSAAEVLRGEGKGEVDSVPMRAVLEALSLASRQVTEDDVERVSQIIFDFDAKHRSDEFIDSDACARAVIAAMQEKMG